MFQIELFSSSTATSPMSCSRYFTVCTYDLLKFYFRNTDNYQSFWTNFIIRTTEALNNIKYS